MAAAARPGIAGAGLFFGGLVLTIFQFPRDVNGNISGHWRIRHMNSAFTGHLAQVDFIRGIAQKSLGGLELHRFVVAYGHRLADAEPWEGGHRVGSGRDEEVIPTVGTLTFPDGRDHSITSDRVTCPDAEPVEETNGFSPVPEDDYDGMDKIMLLSLADAKGLDIDRRWGAPRLREFMREAERI